MAALSRVTVQFSGAAVVGLGSTSFFTTGQVDDFRGPLITLWSTLVGQMPPSCTITIPNTGETYEDSTGELLELWTDGTTSTAVGAGAGNWAQGVGARLVWQTAGTTNNRRVRGSTFVVPITGAAMDQTGTIADAVVTAWQTACNTFITATATNGFSIWTRPKLGAGGKTSGVTGAVVPDRITTLRSRRT